METRWKNVSRYDMYGNVQQQYGAAVMLFEAVNCAEKRGGNEDVIC